MANWSNATLTDNGFALQAKLLSTDMLKITRVVAGTSRAALAQLVNQTEISNIAQELTVERLSYDDNGNAVLKVSLDNSQLTTGYTAQQIGIYATDPEEGEILYAVSQEASDGEDIPSITEQPNGYYCTWFFVLTFGAASEVDVTIDPQHAVTKEDADATYATIVQVDKAQRAADAAQETAETIIFNGDFAFAVNDTGDKMTTSFTLTDEGVSQETVYNAVMAGKNVVLKVNDMSTGDAVVVHYARFAGLLFGGHPYFEFLTLNTAFLNVPAKVRITIFNTDAIGVTSDYYALVGKQGYDYSEEFNYRNHASGYCAHARGNETTADGQCADASGYKTTASDFQAACGKYNTYKEGLPSAEEQSSSYSIYMIGYGVSGNLANAFRVRADGQCYGVKAFLSSGADFPEYEEWEDGNPNGEDRRGRFVKLVGDKIAFAESENDHIIGIVSVMGAFIANSASEEWNGKYMRDVFGEYLFHEVEIPERIDEKTGKVIPAHTATQQIVNPEYNPEEEYIGREFRKEWVPIGKLGQVIVVDDGTCVVGGYCKPSANGIGTAGEFGYYVRKRIDDTHIKVEVEPGVFNK